MKIILDECVPRTLAPLLVGHEVTTVPQAGFAGLKNGALLSAICKQYELFLTVDRNLTFQQNKDILPIKVLVVHASSNRIKHLKPLVPKILGAIGGGLEAAITHVK